MMSKALIRRWTAAASMLGTASSRDQATPPPPLSAWLRSTFLRTAWLAVVLTLTWHLFGAIDEWAPDKYRLQDITLTLQPGQGVLLGRHHLAAPAADERHVRIWRDLAGAWWLSNVSTHRNVAWRVGQTEGQLRQALLHEGQTLRVDGQVWHVRASEPILVLQSDEPDGQVLSYDGARLTSRPSQQPMLQSSPPCQQAPWTQAVRRRWNEAVPHALAWSTPLRWGGTRTCDVQFARVGLPPDGLQVTRTRDGYQMEATAATAQRVCLQDLVHQSCPRGASLFEQAIPIASGLQLTLGRTSLSAHAAKDLLHLTPMRRAGWVGASNVRPPQPLLDGATSAEPGQMSPLPPGIEPLQWRIQAWSPWQWPQAVPWPLGLALGLLTVAAGAALLHMRLGMPQVAALGCAGSALLALASAAAWSLGSGLGPGIALAWIGWAMLSLAWLPGRTGWAWCSHLALALMLMAGLAAQWQLGLQGQDVGAWVYVHKTALLGAATLHVLHTLAWWLRGRQPVAARSQVPKPLVIELALLALGIGALVVLGLQVLLGGELGVFGVQPVEMAKLALVMLGAHALAVRLEWAGPGGWRRWSLWWRLLAPLTLFVSLRAMALLLVRDYSPLLLLLVWLFGMVWAWAAASGSRSALALALLSLALALSGWKWMHDGAGAAWMQIHGFYGDRFAVWLDPLQHPHSGEQLLRALRLATQGGWWGNPMASAWRVPAVQDDMAPAFFAGRFGLAAAIGLLALQAAYLASLLLLGWQALSAVQPGDHRRRWAQRMVFFAAWGAASLFLGHLALSWGTNTGWLPVMGQPMPLVSAGGSVIVLLLMPLHLLWQLQPSLTQVPRQSGR